MNYKIIGGTTLGMLEDEVNKEIEKGYVAVGGICCNHNNDAGCVFQGVMKKEPDVKCKKKNARLSKKN